MDNKKLTENISQVVDTIQTSVKISDEDKLRNRAKACEHIQLTEQEQLLAITEAKEHKADLLQAQNKRLARMKMEEDIRTPWSAAQLMEFVKFRACGEFKMNGKDRKVFELNDHNEKIYKALCLYFSNDPEFETLQPGWKLDKGLLICGSIGLGKTIMMKLFSKNKKQCYEVISCRKIADMFATNGHEMLDFFTQPKKAFFEDPTTFYQRQVGYCFDDLGTEHDKKFFGNEVNVMADIILNRYDRKFDYPWCQTHITTNLTPAEIEESYGPRVRDRMREMFNKISLTGNSMRE